MRELTPEEEAKLLGLLDDTRPRVKFEKDDTYQRKLLAAVLGCDRGNELIPLLQPHYFSNKWMLDVVEIEAGWYGYAKSKKDNDPLAHKEWVELHMRAIFE